MREDGSLVGLLDEYAPSADELAHDHLMDISGSIFSRMREIGITQSELARRAGMDEGRVSKVIRGKENMTMRTLARLEVALDFRLDAGFFYGVTSRGSEGGGTELSVRGTMRAAKPPAWGDAGRPRLRVIDGGLSRDAERRQM